MTEVAKILFIDDEIRIVNSLMGLFYNQYEVYTATEPEQALDILREQHIHVIISDQRMPSMTGVELLSKAKEISPHTVRLLLTGYSDLDAIISSINQGEIFRFINKPWDNFNLKDTIKKAANIGVSIEKRINAPSPHNTPKTLDSPEDSSHQSQANILVVDQATDTFNFIKQQFVKQHAVIHVNDYARAHQILATYRVDIALSTASSTDNDSLALLNNLQKNHPDCLTVVMSDQMDADLAIQMINQGHIFRYLNTPISNDTLQTTLQKALDTISHMKNPDDHELSPIQRKQSIYQHITACMTSLFKP